MLRLILEMIRMAVEYLNQIADGADLCIDCINITTPQQL